MSINYKFQYEQNVYNENANIVSVNLDNNEWYFNSMINSFINCYNLKEVTNINNNVYYMDDTFTYCKNMIDAPVLPTNAKYLIQPFWGCSNLVNAPVIPNNVINMYRTFAWCTNLVNAPEIPNSVTNMYATFNQCHNLVNASDIPNSVIDMSLTFWGCYNLVNAPVIPNSVVNMFGTFYECNSLLNISSISNSVINMHQTFSGCSSLVNAPEIPNGVSDMSDAFRDCTNLVNAPVIPNSVTNMSWTFSECVNLSGDIEIYSEKINNTSACFQLTELNKDVYIPFKNNDVYTETYNSFINAGYSTTERVNGALLIDINYDEFKDWRYDTLTNGTKLLYEYLGTNDRIIVPTNNTLINNYTSGETSTESNTPFFENQNVIFAELENVSWVNNSMAYSFYNAQNVYGIYNIHPDVINFHKAFYNCFNLTEITLPGSIYDNRTDITGMFEGCGNLRNITITGTPGNSATNISKTFSGTGITTTPPLPGTVEDLSWAFENCYYLVNTSALPSGAVNMQGTFYNCYNLQEYKDITSSRLDDMSYTFWNCSNLVNVGSISSSVTNMYQTYWNCSNMNMIPTIPNSVVNMAEAFYNCQTINKVPNISTNVTNMYGTFDSCSNITGMINISSENIVNVDNIFNNTSANKIVYIPFKNNDVYTETYNSFINAGYDTNNRINGVLLKDLNEDPDFHEWRYNTLTNGTKLLYEYLGTDNNIVVPNTNSVLNSVPLDGTSYNTSGYYLNDCPFYNKSNIENVNLNYVPFEDDNLYCTFYNCVNLKSVSNMNVMTTMMTSAFENCFNLVNVPNLPESTRWVGGAFSNCSNLSSAPVFGNNIRQMNQTFYGCSNLSGDILIYSNQINRAENCFTNSSLDKNVYIPFTYENGINTETYNSFINAGYSTTERVNGALLMDINSYDIDLSDYEYNINSTNDVTLTKYIGTKTIITTPHI